MLPRKRKRGKGLPPRKYYVAKERIEANLRKLDAMPPRIPPPKGYGELMESVRSDAEFLMKYANLPEEKLKYIQYMFKIGQMYLWYPWQVKSFNQQEAMDYMMGKAMQAEQDQWKYTEIVDRQRRAKAQADSKKKLLKKTLDKLGATDLIFKKPSTSGLQIRIPPPKPKPIREYEKLLKDIALTKRQIQKYLKITKAKERLYKADRDNKEKYMEWKNAYDYWKQYTRELQRHNEELPLKKKAYEDFKKRRPPPVARPFLRL